MRGIKRFQDFIINSKEEFSRYLNNVLELRRINKYKFYAILWCLVPQWILSKMREDGMRLMFQDKQKSDRVMSPVDLKK